MDLAVVHEMNKMRNYRKLHLCYTPVYSINPNILIKVTFQNARSLHLHHADLKNDHNHTAADIIAVAETRLCPTDTDESYDLPDFNLFRADQTLNNPHHPHLRPPHGLAAYVSTDFIVDHMSTLSSPIIESMFFTVHTCLSQPSFVMGILYKSHKCSMNQTHITYALATVDRDKPILLLGDFNRHLQQINYIYKFCQMA